MLKLDTPMLCVEKATCDDAFVASGEQIYPAYSLSTIQVALESQT